MPLGACRHLVVERRLSHSTVNSTPSRLCGSVQTTATLWEGERFEWHAARKCERAHVEMSMQVAQSIFDAHRAGAASDAPGAVCVHDTERAAAR